MKKTIIRTIPLFFSLAAFAASSNVWADGTTAGTPIENTATINYSVGSVAQTEIESSEAGNTTPGANQGTATSFIVDRKIDLLVTADTGVNNVVPGATTQAVTFKVKNEGNSDETFSFSTATDATDDFVPTSCTTTTNNVAINAGAEASVTVTCDIPASLPSALVVNTNTGTVDLVATVSGAAETSGPDTALEDTVFADNAGTNSGDADRDATHSDTTTYTVATASLTVEKTDAVTKMEINGADVTGSGVDAPKRIPGATVEYTITVTNGGSAATATGIVITDPLPTTMSFVSATLTHSVDGALAAPTSATALGVETVTSTGFDLDASEFATMVITATIN